MTIPLIIIAMVGVLRLLGRRWWCACGRPAPWTSAVTSGCNSQHLADPYSATHLQHGLGLYVVTWLIERSLAWLMTMFFLAGLPAVDIPQLVPAERILLVMALEATWECLENTNWAIDRYRKVTISRGYIGDSIANSVGDALCCLAGAWFASVVPVSASGVLWLVISLGLLVTIRDNLEINIVMLVHPIDWLKRWQNS